MIKQPQCAAGQRIDVSVYRRESHFDRACDEAYRIALRQFGCDDDGYLMNVQEFDRTTDAVAIEFKGYLRCGNEHVYQFQSWIERA